MEELLKYIDEMIGEREEKVIEFKERKHQHEVRFNSGVILGLELIKDYILENEEVYYD